MAITQYPLSSKTWPVSEVMTGTTVYKDLPRNGKLKGFIKFVRDLSLCCFLGKREWKPLGVELMRFMELIYPYYPSVFQIGGFKLNQPDLNKKHISLTLGIQKTQKWVK